MAVCYALKVEGNDEVIMLGGPDDDSIIDEVKVQIDTIDDNTRNKSKGTLARVFIKGQCNLEETEKNSKLNEELTKIFNWSIDFSSNTYRSVTVDVYNDEKKFRVYKLDKMFVRDYQEHYKGTGDDSSETCWFELDLTQQDNHWELVSAN